MTGVNHALTGAVTAAAINRPVLALPAALLSHFAVDIIPHWDYKVRGGIRGRQFVMVFDLFFSLGLLLVLALTVDAKPWLIIAGGLLGILPDTMWLPYFLTGKTSKTHNKNNPLHLLRRFHFWIQWSETRKGIYVEALWFILMLILIFKIHH